MTQILKRLEIIKSSIAIEDEEIIELQIMKLQKLSIDEDVKAILEKLEDTNYAKALKEIETYLARYSGVVEYVDSEVQGLKLELKALESKLQKLVEKKTEYLNDIEEFNREYNLYLGEIIKEILSLKKEILYKKTIKQQTAKEKYEQEKQTFQETKETIDELNSTISELEDALESIDEDDENYDELTKAYNELKEEISKLEAELEAQEIELEKTKEFIEDDEIQDEYEEVKTHYEEFENEYEHIREIEENSIDLNDDEKKELKLYFRKAARLCHPDIAADNIKEKAHEVMQQLNEAYSKKDISKVKEILYALENGSGFKVSSETIEDKELLKEKIEKYNKNIKDIESELEEIKEDETYRTIAELDDWSEYFEELKNGLESEKEKLEEEARRVLEEKIETDEAIKKESSPYAKHIYSIENHNFEKIRRYCNNLASNNEADEMQEYLADSGKMHKALIYDALEQFIVKLNGETITLCDWGCYQGIASMLILDYIKEKQLDIKVSDVILIDNDAKSLSRAMAQVEALAQGSIKFTAVKSYDNSIYDKIKSNKTTLNIFANDRIPIAFLDIDYDIFDKAYFMCVSNESITFVDAVYEDISDSIDVQDVSIRDGKIGRFDKFERIFTNGDDKWIDFLLKWADKNIIQEKTNFPKNKEELSNTKHISLRWNRLKSLPVEFFKLTQLELLELNNNALEVLPNEIGNLKKLKQLDLNINSLKKLPREITNLKNLEVLNIKNNKYLELDHEQIDWLIELKNNGCNVIYDKYKFNLGE